MPDPMVVAAIALGLSLVVSVVRVVHWGLHADPRTVVRAGRWALVAFLLLSVPLLVVLLVTQRWSLAMLAAAFMLLVPALLGWRWVLQPLRTAGQLVVQDHEAGASGRQLPVANLDDPELVRRSAAILAAYVERTAVTAPNAAVEKQAGDGTGNGAANRWAAGSMSPAEALAILGLERGARASQIREAHRRLVERIHPDRGGSDYLTAKINQAKDALLGDDNGQSRPLPRGAARNRGRRRAHP